MFDLDRWQEIFGTFKKNKLRFFLTAFGVSWGIFMFVVMMGAGTGLENGVTEEFNGYATNAIYVWTNKTSKPYRGFKPGRRFRFNNSDTEALLSQVQGIEHLAPRNQLGGYGDGNNISRGFKTGNFSVMGDLPVFIKIQPKFISEGRFINPLDIDSGRKVCVIGRRVADILFEGEDVIIGEYIKIQSIFFKVVGVFEQGKNTKNERETETIFIPFTTYQKSFNGGDKVAWYAFTAKPGIKAEPLEHEIKTLLKSRHSISPADDQAVGSYNTQEEFEKVASIFMGIDMLSLLIGLGTLLAGVIGVTNIMLVVVKERTREIGLRRAIGAGPFEIISQILLESLFLTLSAGVVGMLFGLFILEGGSYLIESGILEVESFRRPGISLKTALFSVGILSFAGLLAGYLPAQRALTISPVDALRTE